MSSSNLTPNSHKSGTATQTKSRRGLRLVSEQAIKQITPEQQAEIDRKMRALQKNIEVFKPTDKGCGDCNGEKGCCASKKPIGETIQKTVNIERTQLEQEQPIAALQENKSYAARLAEPEHIFSLPSVSDPIVNKIISITKNDINGIMAVSKLVPTPEPRQMDSRNIQLKEQVTRTRLVVVQKSNHAVNSIREEQTNGSSDDLIENKGLKAEETTAAPAEVVVQKVEAVAAPREDARIDFQMPQKVEARTVRFRTRTNPVAQSLQAQHAGEQNRTQVIQTPAEERVATAKHPAMETALKKITEMRDPANDDSILVTAQKGEIEVPRRSDTIGFIAKKTSVLKKKELPTVKVAKEEKPQLKVQKQEKKGEVCPSTKIKKEETPELCKEVNKVEKRAIAKLTPKESEIKTSKLTKEKTTKIEKEAKILTNQITKLVANEKFIKLNLRETNKLEVLIKKLLAKRAEMKSKKKISVFELLEIFKKIKKKKKRAKTKLAA